MMLKRPLLLRLSWTLAKKLPFLILVAESKGFSVASRFSLSIRPCPTSLVLFHLSTHAIQFFSLSCISDQHTIPTFRKRDSIFMHVSALPCVFFACYSYHNLSWRYGGMIHSCYVATSTSQEITSVLSVL